MTERQAGRNTAHRIDARSGWVIAVLLCAVLLAGLPARADTSAPIKLAVFALELEDFSAAASSAGATPHDTERLTQATDQVRQFLAKSGRYSVVDVGAADAEAAKAHALRDCKGCDAPIALKLGAEQSFVGVIRRISRTEYVVRFRIRDARTGAVVSDEDSGLRMGADDSWGRGAIWLIKHRLPVGQQ